MRRLSRWFAASFLLLAALAGSSARAAEPFPPVTEAERALTAVAKAPNAPAVVLWKQAEFRMLGYGIGSQVSSTITVQERRKILTGAGKGYGEVAIPHSRDVRLQGLEGRTVLPDGRVLPLTAEAKFVRRVSQRDKRSVTSVAFPGVDVGAILDIRYELHFDSFLYLEPWYLSDELPVLRSEIVYLVPKGIILRGGGVDPYKNGIQSAQETTLFGLKIRIWSENLPPVPDEPYGPPFADLATQVLLLPAFMDLGAGRTPLLESWEAVSKILDDIYDPVRKKDRGVAEAARRIAGAAKPRQQAEALYRFVRDEIETDEDDEGVFPFEGASVAGALDRKRGSSLDKALLLQALLREVKIDARPVWAGDRRRGAIDTAMVNTWWFDRVLVAVSLDGQRIVVDPADRSLSFGQLEPWYEGTPAVVHDRKKPEVITLPEAPFDQNARRAVLDLALDASGRLAGTGELVLTGHHAWREITGKPEDAETTKAWTDWLGARFKEFKISGVHVEESVADRKMRIAWSLAQRDEAVLGDEASLAPSLPLGPVTQPLVQAAGTRHSAVLLSYADRDELELRLAWPEGWKADQQPQEIRQETPAGSMAVSIEPGSDGRSLIYRRRFDLKKKQFASVPEIDALRALYAAMEKSDAQTVSLVRH
jgi:hypothetical protein